jgi:vancomycin resistance protein VanJ
MITNTDSLPLARPTLKTARSQPVVRRIGASARRLFTAFAELYGLAGLLYLLARWLSGERFQPVNIVSHLLPGLALPLVGLWLAFALMRRWRTLALLTPGALAFVLAYGVMLLPRAIVAQDADAPTLTIMTWNMRGQHTDLQQTYDLIAEIDADIVALQELTQPAVDFLTPLLEERYRYSALHSYALSVNGVGIYSAYPILDDTFWLGLLGNMRVEIAFGETRVVVYNVHPPSPGLRVNTAPRSAEIDDLLERLSAETDPLLVVGDFNTTDQSDDYARLTERLIDSYREAGDGLGLTFPNLGYANPLAGALPPIIRIDYIFHDDRWQTLSAYVPASSGGSDHYPVVATLAYVGSEADISAGS